MQIQIKKYEREEEVQFNQLIQICFEEDYLSNMLHSSNLKFAYSAYFDNDFVGILIAWTSSFHPYCTYFRILINPFYNRINIEEKLLFKVEELRNVNVPLQTSIWETSANLKYFYENNGFMEIRRTYMPILKVSDFKDVRPYRSENYLIKTLSEVISNKILFEKLAQVVKRNYEQTHLVNPVIENGVEKWKKMILADDVVLDGTYFYVDMDEKEIIAYSFLHDSDKNDTFEFGWCGTADIKNIGLIPQLTLLQIKYASEHDIQSIIGEFDTTDKNAMEVLRSLPFAPCPTWITYQKE